MNKLQKQQGSAHVVIIVLLVLVVLGALGYVFLQNFNKNTATSETTKTEQSTDASPKLKTFVGQKLGITFKYPETYRVVENYDSLNEDIPKGENLHTVHIEVYNQDNLKVATMTSDFQGGFVCGDEPFSIEYVNADTAKLDIKYAMEDTYYSAFIHGYSTAVSSEYRVNFGITSRVPETTVKTTECEAGSDYYYIGGIGLKEEAPLLFSISFRSTQDYEFESLQEARDYLNTDSYKEVSGIIKSFNFQ